MIVMRQSEIDQHRLARGAKHDARWLDVVVNDVLPVQVGERGSDPCHHRPRLLVSKRQIGKAFVQRLARDALDHDIGLAGEIAGRKAGWHVRSRQPRQDHLLHLETDDRRRILTLGDAGDLHQQRRLDAGMAHAPQRRHAAIVNALPDGEPIDDGAGLDARLGHRSPSNRETIGEPDRQAVVPDAFGRGRDVVAHHLMPTL